MQRRFVVSGLFQGPTAGPPAHRHCQAPTACDGTPNSPQRQHLNPNDPALRIQVDIHVFGDHLGALHRLLQKPDVPGVSLAIDLDVDAARGHQ